MCMSDDMDVRMRVYELSRNRRGAIANTRAQTHTQSVMSMAKLEHRDGSYLYFCIINWTNSLSGEVSALVHEQINH